LRKLADKIRRVGIIGNSEKVSCADAVLQASRLVRAAGRSVFSDAATARLAGLRKGVCSDARTLSRQVDLLLVFGGDGTILSAARDIAGSHTPLLGVNIGSLGFLTAVPSNELSSALRKVWAGQFHFEPRALLEVAGTCDGQEIAQTALNDIVVSRGITTRLVELEVRVDGDALTTYRCDGLIVSSPTGSTAYSLAAGGAVVFPTAHVLELTPICPHTLSNRSLILPSTAKIDIRVVSAKPETILSADGRVVSELSPGTCITVRRSRRTVRLLQLAGISFCERLRLKLHWRGATL
jgi:NAD+ kinase